MKSKAMRIKEMCQRCEKLWERKNNWYKNQKCLCGDVEALLPKKDLTKK